MSPAHRRQFSCSARSTEGGNADLLRSSTPTLCLRLRCRRKHRDDVTDLSNQPGLVIQQAALVFPNGNSMLHALLPRVIVHDQLCVFLTTLRAQGRGSFHFLVRKCCAVGRRSLTNCSRLFASSLGLTSWCFGGTGKPWVPQGAQMPV